MTLGNRKVEYNKNRYIITGQAPTIYIGNSAFCNRCENIIFCNRLIIASGKNRFENKTIIF